MYRCSFLVLLCDSCWIMLRVVSVLFVKRLGRLSVLASCGYERVKEKIDNIAEKYIFPLKIFIRQDNSPFCRRDVVKGRDKDELRTIK